MLEGMEHTAYDEAEVRAGLEKKLREIDDETGAMTRPPTEQSSISFGKRVGDGTQMAVDRLSQVGVHDRLLSVRADVARALAKLDEGSYGRCDVCGEAIAPERLEARPWSVRCVRDANRA